MIASMLKARITIILQLALTCLLWLSCICNTQATVLISGINSQTRNNILAYLQLDNEACDAPDWRVRRLFADSETEIQEALQVVGYYNIEVEKQLEYGEGCWQANFTINLGEAVVLRTVSIEVDTGGEQDKKLLNVLHECALRTGDILHHAKYDSCRRNIAQMAKSRGYFDAKFIERRIDVYPTELAADITLFFETGRRYVFGETRFDQTVLDHELVQRVVTYTHGQAYDAVLTRRIQRDLIASAYFDQVELINEPRGDPYFDVPILIKLTPGKKYQYSAGIGFATDVGPKLRLGVLNRRANSSGHQIEFEINLSKVISETNLSYRIPLKKHKNWFTIDTFFKAEDNDSFESNLFSIGGQHIHKRDDDWIRTLFLNLTLEDYKTSELDDGQSKLLIPGISYSYIAEDYPPRPLQGHRSRAQLSGAIEGLVTDTSFLQVYGNTKWVFGLWPGGRLLTRAEMGATLIEEIDDLPASVRFFAGGDISVRGYAYNSLGPTDMFGSVVGGENLLVGSLEIDHQISANWSLAAFVDSGNAYDRLAEFDPATGIGAGIRWYSLLGPIRLDVAVPLDDSAPDDYRVHITLGPDL